MNNKYLKYRVYSISSEVEPNMAFKLMNDEGGWQSARSCSYPQQITIQFFLPMFTKGVRISFHQYKIPHLVQIFIKGVRKQKYRKLGFIRPSNNQQTNYEQNEIKTIYFEFPCSFIKFVLHKNFQNQYNIFNQVAIEEISVEGELLGPQLLKNYTCYQIQTSEEEQEKLSETYTNSKANQQLKQQVSTREQFKKIYLELEQRKLQAVQTEDFQEAAFIKNELNRFKQMENRMNQLQKIKKKALQSEDFDKCAQLKTQITLLKQSIQLQSAKLFNMQNINTSNFTQTQGYQTQQRKDQYIQIKNVTAIPIKYTDYSSNIYNTAQKTTMSNLASQTNHQNQILPAILKKANKEGVLNNLQEYPTQQKQKQDLGKLQEIDPKLQSKIEHHFEYINKQVWKAIMTKNWKLKQQAFNSIMDMQINSKQKFFAAFQLCSFSITDKHPNIIIHTLLLLNKIITCGLHIPQYQHPPLFVTQILINLIQLFNDTNPKIKELAIDTYQNFADLSMIAVSMPINLLIGKKNTKIKQNPKLVQTKILVMRKLIGRYQYNEDIYIQILEWAITYLQDSNQEIRSEASQLIIKGLLQFLGIDFIRNKVKNIRPNVLGSFNTLLNQSKVQKNQSRNQIQISKKYQINHKNIHTNNNSNMNLNDDYQLSESSELEENNPSLNNIIKQNQIRVLELERSNNSSQNQQEAQYDKQVCQYCNYRNPMMIHEKFKFDHLLNCKVLINCQQCNEKIYIRELTFHHLNQCQEQRYQQCKICELAYPTDSINVHKARNTCKPRLKQFERCQLCQQNIQPNDQAWRAHAQFCNK